MAALTAAAVIGTIAAVASTAHSIEQSNQAARAANQAKNGAQQDADSALAEKQRQDGYAKEQKAANLARDNQRRRIATGGVGGMGMTPPPGSAAAPAPGAAAVPAPTATIAGGNTLLGS